MSDSSKKNISDSVADEIIDTTIDLGIDYVELNLDEIFDGVTKEVPIVKTLYAIGKIGINIKERFFVKKLLTFLKEFHSNKVGDEKLQAFLDKMKHDNSYRTHVTEHIMVFTDTFLNIEKAKIFANLFIAHIQGHYNWPHFVSLSDCLNSINIQAFEFLKELAVANFEIPEEYEERKVHRNGEKESLLYSCGIAYENSAWASSFKVSQLGKDLFQYGIEKS